MSKKHKKHSKYEKSVPEDKPGLKLVLKVGTPEHSDSVYAPEEYDEERKHRHKHKKKKKHKRHHEKKDKDKDASKRRPDKDPDPNASDGDGPNTSQEEADPETAPPPAKKQAVSEEDFLLQRSRRERKHPEDECSALHKCLEYLHKTLQRKDVNGFFAYPVTDNIAPGYSGIIPEPMDFSTMKAKCDSGEYASVMEYKHDFKLMCENCMAYNHGETIYHKEAQKLLSSGLKQMSKERLIQLRKNLPLLADMTDQEIGVDPDALPLGSGVGRMVTPARIHTPKVQKKAGAGGLSKFEAIPDDMTPEEILAQAQDAARDAAGRLTLRKPHSKFGFLRRRKDGSTTFNILNPENDGIVSEKERIVTLGTALGKLQSGTGSLAGFKEDKRNRANPVNYLNYGPFSSYAPVFDSSAANLSKEDSDLLLSTYGDETGVQYANSLRLFVKDAGDYAIRMVDNLLDILTSGEHSKTSRAIQQKEKEEEEKERKEAEEERRKREEQELKIKQEQLQKDGAMGGDEKIDFDSLRTLSDLGIDVSYLDTLETTVKIEPPESPDRLIQDKLDKSSSLLGDLQKAQYDRLSQALPQHLSNIPGPNDTECQLANKVTEELTDLVKQVTPGSVVSSQTLRDAMGVSMTTSDDYDVEVTDISDADPTDAVVTMAAADTTTADTDIMDVSLGGSTMDVDQGEGHEPAAVADTLDEVSQAVLDIPM